MPLPLYACKLSSNDNRASHSHNYRVREYKNFKWSQHISIINGPGVQIFYESGYHVTGHSVVRERVQKVLISLRKLLQSNIVAHAHLLHPV